MRDILFVLSLFLCGCSNPDTEVSHPAFFDKVFTAADSLNTTNYEQALHVIDSSYNTFTDPGIKDLFRKYERKSAIYLFHHRYAEATINIDSMLWIIRNHTDDPAYTEEYLKALHGKCRVLEREGKYAQALEYTFTARQMLEKRHNACGLSEFTCIIAIIKYKQGLYRDACRYGVLAYREALTCADDQAKYVSLQGKLDDIGIYYTRSGMPDSAMYYFNKAMDVIREAEQNLPGLAGKKFYTMAAAVVEGNMGDASLEKGDTAGAIRLYRRSINTNEVKGYDRFDAELTYAKLAGLYLQRRLPDSAAVLLTQFRALLDTVPNRETELKWYELEMQYHALKGRKDLAYDYVQPYLHIKDSINNARQPQFSVDNELERIKNRYELIFLESQFKARNIYLAVAIVILVLSIVVIALLWLYWYRLRKLNRRITSQNEQMQLAIRSVEDSQKENTRMMKIVAHDLRNPVTSMIGITSLMLAQDNLLPEDRQMLELMKTSGENSIDMITDLLNFNTTAKNLDKENVNLQQLLHYCADMLQFKAAEKKQHLVFEMENISVQANKDKMWRVFSNLITNAIKFSPQQAAINIRMHRQGNFVRIEVQDHGIGIPAGMQSRIFDMFTDAKRQGTEGEATFGLGLAIARQIIEAHNGTITVSSTEGKGSTFTILLPAN